MARTTQYVLHFKFCANIIPPMWLCMSKILRPSCDPFVRTLIIDTWIYLLCCRSCSCLLVIFSNNGSSHWMVHTNVRVCSSFFQINMKKCCTCWMSIYDLAGMVNTRCMHQELWSSIMYCLLKHFLKKSSFWSELIYIRRKDVLHLIF